MRTGKPALITILTSILLLLQSCASSTTPTTVIRTAYNPQSETFANILVISVAGDYGSRATFERELVREIANDRTAASAYYTVIGRNPQLTRAYLHDAIRAREFDAVLFTRLQGQEKEELAPMRPVGAAFDLFGYDYSELNRDERIQQSRSITFVTELYSAATQQKVWAINALSLDKSTAAELIAEQAVTVAAQLRKDGFVR
jgi:hypothetical protein